MDSTDDNTTAPTRNPLKCLFCGIEMTPPLWRCACIRDYLGVILDSEIDRSVELLIDDKIALNWVLKSALNRRQFYRIRYERQDDRNCRCHRCGRYRQGQLYKSGTADDHSAIIGFCAECLPIIREMHTRICPYCKSPYVRGDARHTAAMCPECRADEEIWHGYNLELRKVHSHRYSARKHSFPDSFTLRDWRGALSYFNGCCAACGRQLKDLWGTHTAAADHWIPLNDPNCPGTVPANIVPLCHGVDGCNNTKSDKDPVRWAVERFGKREGKRVLARIQVYFDSLN